MVAKCYLRYWAPAPGLVRYRCLTTSLVLTTTSARQIARWRLFKRTRLKHCLSNILNSTRILLAFYARECAALFSLLTQAQGLSLKHQLVKRLLMLTTSYGQHLPKHNAITLTLSQESLAQMINSSRQTVNQLLGELQQEGLVKRHYGKITIPEPDTLFSRYQFIWLYASATLLGLSSVFQSHRCIEYFICWWSTLMTKMPSSTFL